MTGEGYVLSPEQLEQIRRLVDAAPPLTQHQADQIRLIFRRNAQARAAAAQSTTKADKAA